MHEISPHSLAGGVAGQGKTHGMGRPLQGVHVKIDTLLLLAISFCMHAFPACEQYLTWPAEWHFGAASRLLCRVDNVGAFPESRVVSQRVAQLDPPLSVDAYAADAATWPNAATWPEPREDVVVSLVDGCVTDGGVVFNGSHVITNGRWHRAALPSTRPRDRVDLNDTLVTFVIVYGQHYQHFMLETLPRLAIDYNLTRTANHVLINEGVPERFMTDVLGIPAKRIVRARGDTLYCAKHVLFPTFTGQRKIGIVPHGAFRSVVPMLHAYARQHASNKDSAAPTLLYLTRKSGTSRCVANHVETHFLSILKKHLHANVTLDVWDPSAPHSFELDAPRFHRAALVLGPHGGAFANLPFALPGTHVVEFIGLHDSHPPSDGRTHDIRPCYWSMAQALGQIYWQLHPRNFGFDSKNMEVDAEALLSMLSSLNFVHRDSILEMKARVNGTNSLGIS